VNAQPLAQKLLSAHQQNFDVLYLAGVVENDMQNYRAAVSHLQSAIALNPNHFDARFNLGMALAHEQKNQAACEQLEKQ